MIFGTRDEIRVRVRLAPKSAADRIDGVLCDGGGTKLLKVSVTAPAENGKANAALIRLLAKEWHLPRSSISIVAGIKARNKTISVSGDVTELRAMFADWRAKRGLLDED